MREAFRLSPDDLTGGYDYMCVPKPLPDHTLETLRASLARLARQAVAKHASRGDPAEFLS